ncbi:hypothetical protein [Salmonella enterica]|uniref:hypothetical protein n=1 Tax=Salmonella enterica TaxID=28901 RepID=UPI000B28EB8D|nr:hypothetical protein [Salmonella enterica]
MKCADLGGWKKMKGREREGGRKEKRWGDKEGKGKGGEDWPAGWAILLTSSPS